MTAGNSTTFVAALYRGEYLALAAFRSQYLLEIRQHRLTHGEKTTEHASSLVSSFALDYGATLVITETDSTGARLVMPASLPVYSVSLRRGKTWRLGASTVPSQAALFRSLVEHYPSLKRFVSVLSATGNVAMSEYWNTAQLLAVALGLAYLASLSPSPASTPHPTYSQPCLTPYALPTQPRLSRYPNESWSFLEVSG